MIVSSLDTQTYTLTLKVPTVYLATTWHRKVLTLNPFPPQLLSPKGRFRMFNRLRELFSCLAMPRDGEHRRKWMQDSTAGDMARQDLSIIFYQMALGMEVCSLLLLTTQDKVWSMDVQTRAAQQLEERVRGERTELHGCHTQLCSTLSAAPASSKMFFIPLEQEFTFSNCFSLATSICSI